MGCSQKYMIIKDRVEIYKDFAINLLNYIVDFYLDNKTLSLDDDIRNHYNWCFNKVCDEFKEEGLDFSKNEKLRKYFYDFYYHQFYKRENQNTTILHYEKFWLNIFNFDKQTNKNVINTMVELYNIYDTSVNSESNILMIAK